MATMQLSPNTPIGKKTPRVDGPLKVTGTADYTSDFKFAGMLFAVPVEATIANGRITRMDTAIAESMPGVRALYTRKNIGKIFRAVGQGFSAMMDERRPPMEDDVIRYFGQYVAVAIADTFEHATAAADAVKVTYAAEKPSVDEHLETDKKPKNDSERGDADKAFAEAAVQLDETYITPTETHNPIELHSSTAVWDGTSFTLYESTQAIENTRECLSQMLGVSKENVRVVSKFLGSGFGGKLWPWTHSVLAAMAARNLNAPVKLVVTRKQMFQTVGHRPLTQQHVKLGATADGKLVSLSQDFLNHTGILDDYKEDCGEATGFFYSVPNLRVSSALVKRNVGAPTAMRGPGAVPGLFATESAMDELAIKLKLDPVKLRLLNEPTMDEDKKIPFSSRHYVECLNVGSEKFGWANRTAEVGSMKRDGLTLGWGMAGCSWIAARFPAKVSVELHDDGTAKISCGTQDIGTGTYTILALVVSEKFSIPVDAVDVHLGDTKLPAGPISGGSMVTASVIPAVSQACGEALKMLLKAATSSPKSKYNGKSADDLVYTAGRVHLKDEAASQGATFQSLLKQANLKMATGNGSSEGTFGGKATLSQHSYGAHFVEVTWQPEIARLRVNKVVTVIDAGRILNPLAGRNQIEGAVVMGIGMGLFEETVYDPRNGAPINSNLADYIVATNPDVPELDVHFLDYPDYSLNEMGARGVGEIGLAGIASAICNATYHATGIRIRKLPIKIENLLV